MKSNLKEKLHRLYKLAERGATEGERNAAKNRLDKIIEKHQVDGAELETFGIRQRLFRYASELEVKLLVVLQRFWKGNRDGEWMKYGYDPGSGRAAKMLAIDLDYDDWIQLECSYEYFRRHMMSQWRELALPVLKRKRKPKTRNKLRARLQKEFFSRYVIASKLFLDGDLEDRSVDGLSADEISAAVLMQNVEGGAYNKQMAGGNLLNAG